MEGAGEGRSWTSWREAGEFLGTQTFNTFRLEATLSQGTTLLEWLLKVSPFQPSGCDSQALRFERVGRTLLPPKQSATNRAAILKPPPTCHGESNASWPFVIKQALAPRNR